MKQLVVDQVSKSFGKKKALNEISLQIGQGIFGILGPNGAGKTTLMRILATVLTPDQGSIQFNGINWSNNPDQARKMLGYLPQNFGVFRNISACECLDYIGSLKGLKNKAERHQQIEFLLEQVNLSTQAKTKVSGFSGGMLRRLGIAQALLGNPKLLIIDEPTAGLDPEERIRFRNLIRKLSAHRIVLLSTHIVEDIDAVCHGVALMKDGKIEFFPTIYELAKLAENRVWACRIKCADFEDFQFEGDIISTKIVKDSLEARILSENPPCPDALQVSPTIEEGYLVWTKMLG